jgi:hypothetical protein
LNIGVNKGKQISFVEGDAAPKADSRVTIDQEDVWAVEMGISNLRYVPQCSGNMDKNGCPILIETAA